MTNASHKIIFWGTPDFSLPTLEVLFNLDLVVAVIARPDKPQGRGKMIKIGPVSKFAQDNNLPLLQFAQLNDDAINQIRKYLPATFFIVAYGKIIPQNILGLSELPALNIHPSLLPELRGPSPLQTALLNGLTTTGVSLMQLDAKMDHGPILAQQSLTIDDQDYLSELTYKAALLGAELTAKNLKKYLDGKSTPQEQDHDRATFCKMISKEDGEIKWTETAEMIRNKVRAFTPWPSAYFFINNKRFKVLKADIYQTTKLPAGQWQMVNNKLLIGTSQSSLEIKKIQPEGKAVMTGQNFFNGYKNLLK